MGTNMTKAGSVFIVLVCEADLKILMLYVGWVEGMGDDGMRV